MDRRRIILAIIAVLGVIAVGDVYVNGLHVLEGTFEGFTYRIEGPSPTASKYKEASYPAAGVRRVALSDDAASLILRASDVDAVHVQAQVRVYARSEEVALRYLEGVSVDFTLEDGVLTPRVSRPNVSGIQKVETAWRIVTPRDMAVDVDYRHGIVELSGVAGPVSASTTTGMVTVRDVEGPVQIKNDAGNVTVENVNGDVSVQTAFGTANVRSVTGDVGVKNSAGAIEIHDVSGDVTFSGSMGDFLATGIGGNFSGRQEMGQVRVSRVAGEIDLHVRMGSATVQPSAAAPITVTVSQGDLTLILPREITDRYRFELNASRVTMPNDLTAGEPRDDAHLVKVHVPTGTLRVETQ